MGRLQRGMDRDLTKKMTSVDDTFCKDASVCKSARFQTDKKPFTTHFVECLILEELVHATWWWHLPLHPPARSPLHKFLYKMHSRVCKTTLNRTVHSCLQNHKSANQHFMGALRFSPLQKAKPNPQNVGPVYYKLLPYSSGQHVPFCRENVQEDDELM